MRVTSPHAKIKYGLIFLCVSVSAYVLSSLVLSLLDSRLTPVKPHFPVQTVQTKRDSQTKLPVDHYRSIWEKNIFFTSGEGQKEGSEPIRVDQLSLTSLNCFLAGTIVNQEGGGWAVITDNEDGQQEIVAVGSYVKGARVVRILKHKVVLNIDGREELLLMDMERSEQTSSSPTPRSSSVLTYNISRSLVQKSLNDLASVMSQVRAEPHFTGGKPDGFRLSQMRSGSLLNSMGFRNGDVIKSVNGRNIGRAEDAMRLYDAMKGSSFFRVGIIRDNRFKTIQIRVR